LAFLIDSSLFVAFERSGDAPAALLARLGDQKVAVAAITASEFLHGVHRADSALRRGRRERFVETILRAIPVLPFTLEVARIHSRLWADLQMRGEMIGANDLLIAATALTHDMTVATLNQRHFGRIPDLQLALWP
jgi:tRNA(fMet)-specific endonuclease VapC